MDPKICLAGGTGFTGRLIAIELMDREIPFNLLGRDGDRLRLLQQEIGHTGDVFSADFDSSDELDSVLDQTDLMINCVGPFNLFSKLLLARVIKKGIDYLDITGEQSFVKTSHEKYVDEAVRNGAKIVHSLAFESCLADLMARQLVNQDDLLREISSYYYLPGSRPSPGTRLSMQTVDFFPTFALQEYEFTPIAPLAWSKRIACERSPEILSAFFIPYPEIIFFKEQYNTKISGSFMLSNEDSGRLSQLRYPGNQKSLEQIMARHKRRKHMPLTMDERLHQRFSLYVQASLRDGSNKTLCLEGVDMYGVTAFIMAEAVVHYLSKNDTSAGIHSPAEFFEEYPLFDRLNMVHHIQMEEGSDLLQVI